MAVQYVVVVDCRVRGSTMTAPGAIEINISIYVSSCGSEVQCGLYRLASRIIFPSY